MSEIFNYYWSMSKKYQGYFWVIVTCVVLSTVAVHIVQPFVFAYIVDIVSQDVSHIEQGVRGQLFAQLQMLVWWVLLCELVGYLGWRVTQYCVVQNETKTMRDIEQDIQQRMSLHSYGFYTNNFAGSLVNKANRFVHSYEIFLDRIVYNLIPVIVTIAFVTAMLFWFLPQIAWYLIAFTVVSIVVVFLLSEWKRPIDEKEAASNSRMTGHLADVFTNMITIKAFAAEDLEDKYYRLKNHERFSLRLQAWMRDFWRGNVQAILDKVLKIGLLMVGVHYWQQELLSAGTVVLLFTYSRNLAEQLWTISNVIRDTYKAYADAREMMDLLHLAPEIPDPAEPEACKIFQGDIRLDKVSFQYPTTRVPLFTELDLHIPAGQRVGFVGSSGSGKTTITRLLQRFYDILPEQGTVLIDGQDVRDIRQADLRSCIGYVPQDPLLFFRTVRQNIAYGCPQATDEDVQLAARKAHAHAFIMDLPGGYDSLVGERGVKLSGGQRQRIAIARAFLRQMLNNTPVLILDEATSSLDSSSEQAIQQALLTLLEENVGTTIVIAHRLSTIMQMDTVYVFDDGKIIQAGSPKELLEQDGTFQRLWQAQTETSL
ncbi:MAG: ABC transporter ATP-binding protein [Candidatus Peribacteria bacterium]|nr:MAG: ABC transporter ATP-binding protein [Candidatus Peribacteria bacterium]